MRKKAYVIGDPISHSISPAMHNAAAQKLGLDLEYAALRIKPSELANKLKTLRAPEVVGFNVTIPHKEAIMPLLDNISAPAELIGAVNTVVKEDNKLVGYNTDGAGFIESLRQDARFEPKGKNVVVIGAGGASRAITVMLAEAGAKRIIISDIDEGKAEHMAGYVDSSFEIVCESVKLNSPDFQQALLKADLLVNASPVGMHPKVDASPLGDKIKLPKRLCVYDLVYTPAVTKLLKQAKLAGCQGHSGLGMLVRQGALSFTLWTGEETPIEVMRLAAKKALHLP